MFTHIRLVVISSWHLQPWLETTYYAFVQQWASLLNFFICSYYLFDAFHKSPFFHHCISVLHDTSSAWWCQNALDSVDIWRRCFPLKYWMCAATNTYPMMYCAQVFYTWVPVIWAMCVNQALSVHFPANLKNTYSSYYGW